MSRFCMTIPTIRMRDVGEAVTSYAEHFRSYGHDVPLIVFDDGKTDQGGLLRGRGEGVFYVGPAEKEAFLLSLISKVGEEGLVRRIFRPSYGGNRNFTLAYTVGDRFMTADDDMRPHGIFNGMVPLRGGEVSTGKYVNKEETRVRKGQRDVAGEFSKYIGRRVCEIPPEVGRGAHVEDSMTNLLTNTTRVKDFEGNVLTLAEGSPQEQAVIKHAQTFRTGSADVDAKDYIDDFLVYPELPFVNDMSVIYAISSLAPCVTDRNWRVDCGVSAYDNSTGLPPFFPTALRFEDYGFRIWLQHPGVASAHVAAVQTHYRNPYMRDTLAADYHNEAVANLLKDVLRGAVEDIRERSIVFGPSPPLEEERIRKILTEAQELHAAAVKRIDEAPDHQKGYYEDFRADMEGRFFGFDFDSFFQDTERSMTEEAEMIRKTMGIWENVLEASSDIKTSGRLPLRRIE